MRQLHLKFWVRRLMPFIFCLALIFCHLIPFHFLPYYPYAIQWLYIPIFYFAIYNPKCLSSWAVFLLGILTEMIVQSPLGVTIFSYVLLFFIANFLRKYLLEMTFFPLWIVFCALVFGIELIMYALTQMLTQYAVSFEPVLVEYWVLVLVYPFMMRWCAHLDRKAREAVP